MTTTRDVPIVTRVRAWLEALGDALAGADLPALVRAERQLVPLLTELTAMDADGSRLEGTIREDAELARLALARCRRLGAIFDRGHGGLAAAAVYDGRGQAQAGPPSRGFASQG